MTVPLMAPLVFRVTVLTPSMYTVVFFVVKFPRFMVLVLVAEISAMVPAPVRVMVLVPSAREATATPRMVWDLDPGIGTVPRSLDCCTVSFIFLPPPGQKGRIPTLGREFLPENRSF